MLKMTSTVQCYRQKNGLKTENSWEKIEDRRALQNGRTFHLFHQEEIIKLLPKILARTARLQFDR